MRANFWSRTQKIHLAILKSASAIVPAEERLEWQRAWQGELWHVHRALVCDEGIDWRGEFEVARFCLGAFQDALSFHRESIGNALQFRRVRVRGSAAKCILTLAALALACACLSWTLPGARWTLQAAPFRDAGNLMLVGSSSYSASSAAAVRADQFRAWKSLDQHLFTDFAFYEPTSKLVHLAPRQSPRLEIARSSPNLLDLLGLHLRLAAMQGLQGAGLPHLVLSERAWKIYCGRDEHVLGRIVRVGTRNAVLAGVIEDAPWSLPGRVDAWLLEPDADAAAVPDATRGFVIARLTQFASSARLGEEWTVSIPRRDGAMDSFRCVSVAAQLRLPGTIFLFTVVLALLALPATTPLALGEYPIRRHRLSVTTRLNRWLFLACKIALILPIIGLGSLDLAYASGSLPPVWSQYIQLICSFSGCLFALRWVLKDQRKRCPVCLGQLTNPAEVGQKSRNFLAWYGTELICSEGHGLLHVPELPTSWFATQRWLYLDPSWEVLFSDRGLAPTTST